MRPLLGTSTSIETGIRVARRDTRSAASASRRSFLLSLSLGTALFTVPGAFAEELMRKTARVEEGPFYPPKLPLDTDNDLLIVNDSITPAVGDGIWTGLDSEARASVTRDFVPLKESRIGELGVKFDIVLGLTA